MKTYLLWLCTVVSLFAASEAKLAAQSSCFTFSGSYAVYTDESTDGTNLYTSVLVDGSGSMNITGGNGCSQINYSYAMHTPMALNVISNASTYVGGMQSGDPECPSCYLSKTNYQSIAATPGVDYNFTWGGSIACNFGGSIYSTSGWIGAKISLATYQNANLPPIGGYYEYRLACPGSSVPTCPSSILTSQQNYKWAEESDVQITEGGKQPYCLGVRAVAFLAGWPAPFDCR